MRKYKCNVCKEKFELSKDRRYTAYKTIGPLNPPKVYFDAFDCPHCGCQNLLNVREQGIPVEPDFGEQEESEE